MDKEKLQQLKTLLETLQNGVSKTEFLSSFKEVLSIVVRTEKSILDRNQKINKELTEMFGSFSKEIKGANENELSAILQKIDKAVSKALKEQEDSLNFIRDKVRKIKEGKDGNNGERGRDGTDGKTPTINELLALIKPLIPSLPEAPKPKAEEVDGLDKFVRDRIPQKSMGIGMRKVPIVRAINLTDQVDGVATTFNLPRDTVRVLAVFSTQFPIIFDGSADFSLAGQTLTLNTGVVQSGQTLNCLIETLFYA